jgi:hypothetical protein
MDIPLTSDEVKTVIEASAFLNVAYREAFNTLAALTKDGEMRDPRVSLLSLQTSRDALSEIRRAVGENPRLTDDHIADILAIQETIPQELLDLGKRRIAQSMEALEGGVTDAESIEAIRHAGIGKESRAVSKLDKLFDMVTKKITPNAPSQGVPPSR